MFSYTGQGSRVSILDSLARRHDHIPPILRGLHCRPVRFRIVFKSSVALVQDQALKDSSLSFSYSLLVLNLRHFWYFNFNAFSFIIVKRYGQLVEFGAIVNYFN